MPPRSRADAIVPAAGRSSRMGRPKLLLPFGSSTVVGSLVEALRHGGVERVCLVVAPGDERLSRWARDLDLLVTVNPAPQRGMLSSIQAGLAALVPDSSPPRAPLLITPADLPALAASTVEHLLTAATAAGAPLAVPVFRGRRGHPLLVAGDLVAEITTLDPAIGLRQLLDRHAAAVLEVPVNDPGCVHDVDTPDDYRRLAEPSS